MDLTTKALIALFTPVVLYILVKVIGAAWFRAREEHIARLGKLTSRDKVKLKQSGDNHARPE